MYELTDKQLTQIQQVLAQSPRLERAVLFGSRAEGMSHPGSDVDLALFGGSFALRDHIDRVGVTLYERVG